MEDILQKRLKVDEDLEKHKRKEQELKKMILESELYEIENFDSIQKKEDLITIMAILKEKVEQNKKIRFS